MELDKIYNEDCLEGMKKMPDDSVDCSITSPPYNFNLRIHYGRYGGRGINDPSKYNGNFDDGLPIEVYYNWQKQCIDEMLRVSRGLVFYNIQMITGNKLAFCQLIGHYADKVKEIVIWDKINAEPAIRSNVMNSSFEFVVIFDKNNAISRQFQTFNADRGTLSNIVRINKNRGTSEIKHKAMFPIELPRYFVSNFTKENDVVLDPFMGSGTTAIAAIRERRHFIGFELNKEYYDKACERIKNEQRQLTLF